MNTSPYRFKGDPHSSHALILARLGEGRGRRALDAGAADGFLAERMTARGWHVTAIERDPDQAARARGRCHELVVADLADAASVVDVLEHLSDPLPVLSALNQRLARGGRVVASVPNVAHLWMRLALLLGRFDYADRGILDRTHLRFFTRRTFVALLRQAGLDVDRVDATPVPLPLVVPERLHGRWLQALHAVNAATARAWPRGLAYQFVAVCRPRVVGPPRGLDGAADTGARPARIA
jgi:SAM-dependent methyltransferase